MTLSAQQIEQLLQTNSLSRGRALFEKHQSEQHFNRQLSPGQRRFVEQVSSRPDRARVVVPDHPERLARPRPQRERANGGELSPTELMWLQRLPSDPSAVTFDDAVELATIAASIDPTTSPASARLIKSIWNPVKALHDNAVAKAQLDLASQPLGSLPDATQVAIQEAVAAEHPGLGENSIAHEAAEIMGRIDARRRSEHDGERARAQRAADEAAADLAALGETRRTVEV